ncbi:hypothetical protein HPB51_015593 [Rhipicephalus microplus]|uniref:HTH CENPB-type domain-containing protein n=1 Tax=Rhipicephalus microplus TaxID=6941 RepID=A0A9J6DGZ5_RHIMP|nr:hypothetical protein HPB51_015593 [Rhipicephalus microplus]
MASRKQKELFLEEKRDVLKAIDKQPAQKRVHIAKDLGLPPSKLNSIAFKHTKIEGNATLLGSKAKQAHSAKHENIDDALVTWLKQARIAGINFDRSILHEKVMGIADRLGITDFPAFIGWIDCSCKRHGIAYKTVSQARAHRKEKDD